MTTSMTTTKTRIESGLSAGERRMPVHGGGEMSEMRVRLEETGATVVYRIHCSADDVEPVYTRIYSISAEMIAGGRTVDFALVYDATRSRLFAMELLMKVSRNRVTPCTLADVIADCIA